MRACPVVPVVLLSLSAFHPAASAITVADLPATIQSCVTAGDCDVDAMPSYISDTAQAFLIRNDVDPFQSTWLTRYALVPPSGERDSEGAQLAAYGGYLWMQTALFYDAADSEHAVTLFLDKVTPAPASLLSVPYDDGPDLTLLMTTADLLAGSAYRIQADPGYGDLDEGSLSGEIPLICLAEGCRIEARLNLPQMKYEISGDKIVWTGFDSSDTRGLVYSQASYYFDGAPPDGSRQDFAISAVPEPATAWFFGAGLLGVGALARRRRTT